MATPFYEVVNEKMGEDVFKDLTVLDVGCARFAHSIAMRDMGAKVTAIDTLKREESPENIQFVQTDFLEWQTVEKFGMLYLSNVALFMPTELVFKKIATFDPKIIAVRTMYDYPSPNWDASELKTLYFTKPHDWTDHFEPQGFKTIHSRIYEEEVEDMRGRVRLFRFTEYIGKR